MRFLLVCIFFLACRSCYGQELVLNGGFEEENTCTEYVVNCAPEAWVCSGLLTYFKDANRAHDGTHCMGLLAGHTRRPYLRSFVRAQLPCPLRKGTVYRLRFFIKSPAPVLDSVGVYFGKNDFLLERKPIHLLSPSLFLAQGNTFRRDSSWQPVVLDFKSEGDELFLTIGNFAHNDVTGASGLTLDNNFLVLLDDVSLVSTDASERPCGDWKEAKQRIYDQDARHQFLQKFISYHRNDGPLNLPLHPSSMQHVDTLLLPDVLFATNKTDLQPSSFVLLDSFCRAVAGRKVDSLVIEGHADSTGSTALNERLSTGRAASVAGYLRQCAHFFRVPFFRRGWGSTRPVTGNGSPEGRRRNRRVEAFLYIRE